VWKKENRSNIYEYKKKLYHPEFEFKVLILTISIMLTLDAEVEIALYFKA
jgi:hypothetical protein